MVNENIKAAAIAPRLIVLGACSRQDWLGTPQGDFTALLSSATAQLKALDDKIQSADGLDRRVWASLAADFRLHVATASLQQIAAS